MPNVAALFVQPSGCYSGLPGVDAWDEARDAREYRGPHRVVAHPPCARWSKYWFGGAWWVANGRKRKVLGDDEGCFASALRSVLTFGGVLEHPAYSHAWNCFHITHPPPTGGWVRDMTHGGWTCHVEQGHYGHRAAKATWLYAHGVELPSLRWGQSNPPSVSAKARERGHGNCMYLGRRERNATPIPFRDLLLAMARG